MVFDKIASLFGSRGAKPPQLLITALEPLKVKGTNLADATVAYVASGEPSDAPVSIANSADDELRLLLGAPGGPDWPSSWQTTKALEEQVRKQTGKKLRSHFNDQFRLYTKRDTLDAAQWVRLGRVLAAASDAVVYTDDEVVPRWLAMLWGTTQRIDPSGNEHKATAWDVSFALTLLEADARTPHEAATAVIQLALRSAPSNHRWGRNRRPRISGFAALADEHHDIVVSEFSASSSDDKQAILSSIKQDSELSGVLDGLWDLGLIDSAKGVRESAARHIAQLSPAVRAERLERGARAAAAGQAETAIDYLARLGDDAAIASLAALGDITDKRKAQLIEAAAARADDAASGDEELVIPPAPELHDGPIPEDFAAEGARLAAAMNAKDRARLEQLPEKAAQWERDSLNRRIKLTDTLDRHAYDTIAAYLDGTSKQQPKQLDELGRIGLIPTAGLSLVHRVRLFGLSWQLMRTQDIDVDLRSLAQAAVASGVGTEGRRGSPTDFVANLPFSWNGLSVISVENAWAYFAENPKRLDQALGIDTTSVQVGYYYDYGRDMEVGITLLQAFPALPGKYVARLAEVALGTAKTNREFAQDTLAARSNAGDIAARGLTDSRMEVRSTAAAWLGRMGSADAVAPLRAALKKEKRETVMAAILGALHRLGEDLSDDLSPATLTAQAEKGLKAKAPTALGWLQEDLIPDVAWADGTPVQRGVIVWWLRLATKLKDPLGAGLLPIYVSLLDKDSQERLGEFVLRSWIGEDTLTVSAEEAERHAASSVDAIYASNQHYAKLYPSNQYYQELGAKSKEETFEQLRRGKLSEYLGSATGSKGILSLTVGAPGHVTYGATTQYYKTHTGRRSQIEALVTAASGNDDPAAIQLVLQVARRFKQRTVQEKATELVEQIAERRGWTADELADRTIPTAGFDDDGLLHLDYGPREFVGRLGRSPKGVWQIELSNADGKVLKALPAAAKTDDAELVKETKKQLTTSKKEIKQLVDLQTGRLFEAMCIQRSWPADQWRELIAGHAVLGQVITGQVWSVHDGDSPAESTDLFRLTPEGELIGIDDETFELDDAATVRLAHAATTTAEAAEAWKAHLDDYDAQPVFQQFDTAPVEVSEGATEVTTRLGWLSDSFAIRGRATKRGYARGQGEDGGWFTEYFREYQSVGLRAVIHFTGSFLPEELIPAAITELTFERLRGGKRVPLADVPPILLAETIADYEHVADGGQFDPDWESKSQY